ncbi:MAG: site-specific integrase [Actinomycetia bacterium]|nr:site-specific integrase [Actinomycetes bacterium]
MTLPASWNIGWPACDYGFTEGVLAVLGGLHRALLVWLDDVARSKVAESSHAEYAKRIKRVSAKIGHVKLGRLSIPHVQALAAELSREYSPKTARTTLETLRAALGWAQSADMISRNPAEHVSIARSTVAKIDDSLTAEEAAAVLHAAKGDELEALFWLAIKYGLRLGELLDLKWEDVDFESGELHVRQAKTAAGVRALPLIPDALHQLEQRRRLGGPTLAHSYVFPGPGGRQRRPQLTRRDWNRLLAKANVEHRCRECASNRPCSTSVRRFHASRHTVATLLLEAGVALEVVSAILGHSSIGVTANIYAKVRSDLKRRGLEALTPDG